MSYKNTCCSCVKKNPIKSQFCACHDSLAVVTCSKLWPDWMGTMKMTSKRIVKGFYFLQVIVHEWAHLRYGVFDEYPDQGTGTHFYAAANGEIEGTRCSSELTGESTSISIFFHWDLNVWGTNDVNFFENCIYCNIYCNNRALMRVMCDVDGKHTEPLLKGCVILVTEKIIWTHLCQTR